jgi:hypothetical protein
MESRIPADASKHAPNNSYSPPLFYEDKPFVCADCGKEEIWTALQQKWWYEVAKGTIYSRAVRCRACRKARRATAELTLMDPNPIKHVGSLMKRVRSGLEPALLSAGFAFDGTSNPGPGPQSKRIDYVRPGILLSILFNSHIAQLSAESVDQQEGHSAIAKTCLEVRTTKELMTCLDAFLAEVLQFVDSLPPVS